MYCAAYFSGSDTHVFPTHCWRIKPSYLEHYFATFKKTSNAHFFVAEFLQTDHQNIYLFFKPLSDVFETGGQTDQF
jgi:predicted ATPase